MVDVDVTSSVSSFIVATDATGVTVVVVAILGKSFSIVDSDDDDEDDDE